MSSTAATAVASAAAPGPAGIDGRGAGGRQAETNKGPVAAAVAGVDQEGMWQMSIRGRDLADSGPYPERPEEPDCSFYMRTGQCRFGMTCKFNHPPNRKLTVAIARMNDEYPQRAGQPECQYYLKTGTCKFGASCKFNHPIEKAGSNGQVQLNMLGYPLRQGEKECGYYLRTGQCKFGSTCKFHHPQPSNTMVYLRGSPVYLTTQSASSTGQQQSYPGPVTNWALSKTSFMPSPRWQGPSSYAQLILPQGVLQVSGWNAYSSQMGSSNSEEQQQTGAGQYYQNSHKTETSTLGEQGVYSSYQASSVPFGVYTLQGDNNAFPERPDQPECQFYMKTGDCKFGATCKFHHPKERLVPAPNCPLSPLGLPLRPGEQICTFYCHYGICKFGPNCKFDHPMEIVMYGGIATAPTDKVPTVHRLLGSSSSGQSDGFPNNGQGKSRRLDSAAQMTPTKNGPERDMS